MRKVKGNRGLKLLGGVLFLGLVVCAYSAWMLFSPKVLSLEEEDYLLVPTGGTFQTVRDSLQAHHLLKYPQNFQRIAKLLSYPDHVRAGKYKLEPAMSHLGLIRLLRSGKQEPVNLVINKVRLPSELADLMAGYLEPDREDFLELLKDSSFLSQFGLDSNTAISLVIPNTYQFFWNTSAETALERLEKEKNKFWTEERIRGAEALGLSVEEAYTLASIVQEESIKEGDQPLIASVYLNRIEKGMPLQADPTIKFSMKDFSVRRITHKMTATPSPFNTYVNKGFPPGPICTPAIKTIDAVLRAPKTSYLYFCAKSDFSGYHVFATTYSDHLKNARAYQTALNERNIR